MNYTVQLVGGPLDGDRRIVPADQGEIRIPLPAPEPGAVPPAEVDRFPDVAVYRIAARYGDRLTAAYVESESPSTRRRARIHGLTVGAAGGALLAGAAFATIGVFYAFALGVVWLVEWSAGFVFDPVTIGSALALGAGAGIEAKRREP